MSRQKYQKPLHVDLPFDEAVERFAQTDPEEVRQEVEKDEAERVRLIQHNGGPPLLIYSTAKGAQVELPYQDGTLWATQQQMSEMFGINVPSISRHLKSIFEEGELIESATVSKIERVAREGDRDVRREIETYNLNAIISVGYRVSSKHGTLFRIWATDRLVQILTKGFYIDRERLRDQGDYGRLKELRDIIRDIRASEANVYAELRRICAMCQDYDGKSQAARKFYSHMQAKLYWAVVSHTPSEVLVKRIHADRPNLGLQTWPKENIRQEDALNAKNTLEERELQELNRVTSILLDVFEDQIDVGRLTLMSQATALLDRQLSGLGRPVLRHGGSVSSEDAEKYAKAQYKIFDERRRLERKAETEAALLELKQADKQLPKPRKRSKKS